MICLSCRSAAYINLGPAFSTTQIFYRAPLIRYWIVSKPLNTAVKLFHSQCKIPFSFTSPDQYQTDFKKPHNACESFESYCLDFSQLRRNTFLTIRKVFFWVSFTAHQILTLKHKASKYDELGMTLKNLPFWQNGPLREHCCHRRLPILTIWNGSHYHSP